MALAPAAFQPLPLGAAGGRGHSPTEGRAGGSPLTVVHEGFAAPVGVPLAPRAAVPQRRLMHVGLRLRLQPAPARQGDDAHDDGQAQQQGQEPPAPPAGEAAHHHPARPAQAPSEPERRGCGVAGTLRRDERLRACRSERVFKAPGEEGVPPTFL